MNKLSTHLSSSINFKTWHKVNENWYRETAFCDIECGDRLFVAGTCVKASCLGGPIVLLHSLTRDNDAPLYIFDFASLEKLTIHTYNGTLLSSISWIYERPLVCEWSVDFLLIVVFVTGVVRIFSLFGEIKYCYALSQKVSDNGDVLCACIRPDVSIIAIITKTMTILVNQALNHSECIQFQTITAPCNPTSMIIVFPYVGVPNSDLMADMYILVATNMGNCFVVNNTMALEVTFLSTYLMPHYVSFDQNRIIALCKDNSVAIFSCHEMPNLSLLYSFMPPQNSRIVQIAWIGEDCIICHAVSPPFGHTSINYQFYIRALTSEWINLNIQSNIAMMIPELDGVRIIRHDDSLRLERVAFSTQHILLPDSNSPFAPFLSAWTKHQEGDPCCNDLFIKTFSCLPEVLLLCLDAALHEYDTRVIFLLLNAFAFGRLFLKEYLEHFLTPRSPTEGNPEGCHASHQAHEPFQVTYTRWSRYLSKAYILACQDLRVVQALSQSPHKIYLTVSQLRKFGRDSLLRCLAQARLHFLAIKIAESWGLGSIGSFPIIWNPSDIDCSQELRDICSPCWAHPSNLCSTQQRLLSYDATRPLGVSLALEQDTQEKGPVNYNVATKMLHSAKYNTCCFWIVKQPNSLNYQDFEKRKEQLRAAVDFVLDHWVTEKISLSPHLSDQQLFDEIKKTLTTVAYLKPKFVHFVIEAVKLSRPHLAVLLLQYEPRSRVQIRILLRLAEYELAMKQAVKSCDVDLLVECFSTMEAAQLPHGTLPSQGNPFAKFLKVFSLYPYLYDFYEAVCLRQKKFNWIKSFYEEASDFGRAAWVCLIQALLRFSDREMELFAHSAAFFGSFLSENGLVSLRFTQSLVLEHVELINLQKQWDEASIHDATWGGTCRLHGLALFPTVKELFIRHRFTEIETLKKLFSIPESRIVKIKIQALLEQNSIHEVEKLAQLPDTLQHVGGIEFFISALRCSGKSDYADRLMPILKSSTSQKKTWLPRVFRPLETSDMKRVASVLASLREEPKMEQCTTVRPQDANSHFEKLAQSVWESFKGAISRKAN